MGVCRFEVYCTRCHALFDLPHPGCHRRLADRIFTGAYRPDGTGYCNLPWIHSMVAAADVMGFRCLRDVRLDAVPPGIVPIALQIIWWFVSVLPLLGSYGLNRLFIRFNSPNDYELYWKWTDEIALNRSFYLILSVLLAAGAAWLWERNRSRLDSAKTLSRKTAKGSVAASAAEALR